MAIDTNRQMKKVTADSKEYRPLVRRNGKSPAFGQLGALSYDDDAKRFARRYRTAHKTQNDIVITAVKRVALTRPIVIDLGCGTSKDGFQILTRVRNAIYVGIDCSIDMLGRAREKLADSDLQQRSLFIRRDFRRLTRKELLLALDAQGLQPTLACVMSTLALHHYSLSIKRDIYQLAHDLLPDKGVLVLTDLYSNGLKYCAERALKKELDDVRACLSRLQQSGVRRDHNSTTISERHYVEENKPQVLSDEIGLLSRIGFGKIDVVFRDGQLAVIAAER